MRSQIFPATNDLQPWTLDSILDWCFIPGNLDPVYYRSDRGDNNDAVTIYVDPYDSRITISRPDAHSDNQIRILEEYTTKEQWTRIQALFVFLKKNRLDCDIQAFLSNEFARLPDGVS